MNPFALLRHNSLIAVTHGNTLVVDIHLLVHGFEPTVKVSDTSSNWVTVHICNVGVVRTITFGAEPAACATFDCG